MKDIDKVIIALGFFTVVGFIAYCVLAITKTEPAISLPASNYVTVAELQEFKKTREAMRGA